MDCATPPSEPDMRISRIRLSGRWFTSRGLTNMLKGVARVRSLSCKGEPKLCLSPFLRVVNGSSFPEDSDLFRAPEEESPIGLALWHSHGLSFCLSVAYPSTFLHPFAPRALPRFLATTGALTPARRALRAVSDNEHPPCIGQVSLLHMTRPFMHSVTKHLTRPATASPLPAQRDRLPGLFSRSGLHPESAGSSLRTAESCSSSSYGLHVRLRLLPTPPHGDAVTFSYQERASPERGLSPLQSHLLAGARIPAFAGMTIIWFFRLFTTLSWFTSMTFSFTFCFLRFHHY